MIPPPLQMMMYYYDPSDDSRSGRDAISDASSQTYWSWSSWKSADRFGYGEGDDTHHLFEDPEDAEWEIVYGKDQYMRSVGVINMWAPPPFYSSTKM